MNIYNSKIKNGKRKWSSFRSQSKSIKYLSKNNTKIPTVSFLSHQIHFTLSQSPMLIKNKIL